MQLDAFFLLYFYVKHISIAKLFVSIFNCINIVELLIIKNKTFVANLFKLYQNFFKFLIPLK